MTTKDKAKLAYKNREVAPPDWEGTVTKMKDTGGVDNPFALAWWMKDQGFNPKGGKGQEDGELSKEEILKHFNAYQLWLKSPDGKESNAASSLAALTRPGAKVIKESFRIRGRFLEASFDEEKREIPVVLLVEGIGNKRDKHYYTAQAIQGSATKFDGAQCYLDHPTALEESQQPERTLEKLIGWFKEVHAGNLDGKAALLGVWKCVSGAKGDHAWALAKEAVAYQKEFPNQEFVGFSINASGVTHPEQKEGSDIVHFVDEISDVVSCDMVTKAGAGGKLAPNLRESIRLAFTKIQEGVTGNMEKKLKAGLDAAIQKMGEMKAMCSEKYEKGKEGEAAPVAGAIDEIISQLQSLMKAEQDEPGEEGLEKKTPPVAPDAGADAGEEAIQASGMKEAEKAVVLKAYRENRDARKIAEAEKALVTSKVMVDKLLRESKLPAGSYDDLKEVLIGKDPSYCKKLIEARRNLITTLADGNHGVEGAGAKSADPDKLKEAKRSKVAGIVPLKTAGS